MARRDAPGAPSAPPPSSRRWVALHNRQVRDEVSSCIIRFVAEAMAPGRYLQDQPRFEALSATSSNRVLAGLSMPREHTLRRSDGAAFTEDSLSWLSQVVDRLEGARPGAPYADSTHGRYTLAILTEQG